LSTEEKTFSYIEEVGKNLSYLSRPLETRASTGLRAGQVVCQCVPNLSRPVRRDLQQVDSQEAALPLARHRVAVGDSAQAL
jgi:hypothetical protein